MNFLRRSLVGLFLVALTFGLLAWAGHMVSSAIQARLADQPGQRPARERVFAANVVTVTPETISPVLTAFGEVRARRTLDLRAEAGGRVVDLHPAFEEGGRVKAGELILRVDPSNAQWARDVAQTDLAGAEADLRDAERKLVLAREELAATGDQARLRAQALARQQDLRARGVGTDATVEDAALAASAAAQAVVARRQSEAQAEAALETAHNALARARIRLAEAERALADTELFAAFSGTLAEVSQVEGGLVTPNERVAQLIDPAALEVAFRVSTAQYTRLLDQGGALRPAPVTAVLDVFGADLTATGQLIRESGAVAQGQAGRLLFASLENAPGFRPGDFVTVHLEEPPLERVARLPATALDAAAQVLVLGEDDRLEAVQVELLRRQGDDVIVRAAGLAGREVVAERTPLLGAGIRVRPLRPGAEAAGDAPETVELSPERRAALIAFVESNPMMPDEAKARVRAQLEQDRVPVRVVERLESRMGG
ncbi:efflux RND transporter periplasmic adaptor subunit [Rhodovulum strictum]|uniref:HlyD family efflux transporter periplasmic adaptor subunit n=1 Tax=Rhodovulum strictum TaxID=58314 RepID=A0A844B007_9RHOB|nr:HlyD family efflux transporter periplasmic adaptor subunit [Rhodovulum strictum]MRH19706.1 HlyD family efflux transporter periplasmic adaptor subunit [Rhodovulum strictum]